MFNGGSDLPQKPFQLIKQDDKFFSRLLSKESSASNPSFRVYYGGTPSSVPFAWETQPGTPKQPSFDDSLPPLTPPPSYYLGSNKYDTFPEKKCSRSNLLRVLFFKTSLKNRRMWPIQFALSAARRPLPQIRQCLPLRLQQGGGSRAKRLMSYDSSIDDEHDGSPPISTRGFSSGMKSRSFSARGHYRW